MRDKHRAARPCAASHAPSLVPSPKKGPVRGQPRSPPTQSRLVAGPGSPAAPHGRGPDPAPLPRSPPPVPGSISQRVGAAGTGPRAAPLLARSFSSSSSSSSGHEDAGGGAASPPLYPVPAARSRPGSCKRLSSKSSGLFSARPPHSLIPFSLLDSFMSAVIHCQVHGGISSLVSRGDAQTRMVLFISLCLWISKTFKQAQSLN